jgi:pentatricopeptide repeat protein
MESLKIRPYPLSIGRLGEVRLLVKDDDLEKAKAVLRIMKDSTKMEPDNDR